jgi:iron-sulfur cluster repair protein YtfE (RIC family)
MEKEIELINRTIKEHEQIITGIQTSEGIINDVAAMSELDRPVEKLISRRLEDTMKHLEDLHKSLGKLDVALHKHFEREETAVLKVFKRESQSLASAFSVLLEEHDELKKRISKSEKIATDLLGKRTSREVWEGKAYGLRAHIRHTRKLIEAHATSEAELFRALRKELQNS